MKVTSKIWGKKLHAQIRETRVMSKVTQGLLQSVEELAGTVGRPDFLLALYLLEEIPGIEFLNGMTHNKNTLIGCRNQACH